MARLSKFHNWHNDAWERQEYIKDDNVDTVTGGTTRFQMGVDGDQAGYDRIRPATHVGPRRVDGCLRGHDDGDLRVDDGVEAASFLFRKRGQLALPELGTFSRFAAFSKLKNNGTKWS